MHKKYILFILLAIVAVGAVYFYTNSGKPAETEITKLEGIDEILEDAAYEPAPIMYDISEGVDSSISNLINEFFTNLAGSAPPTSDIDSSAAAANLFTAEAKSKIPNINGMYALAPVVGIQDLPDRGYEIKDVAFEESKAEEGSNTADVTVILKYSGGNVQRLFKLVKVEDTWKISDIESQ